jgi:hypothetical protein
MHQADNLLPQFSYVTKGHNLNTVETEPAIIGALGKHLAEHNLRVVKIDFAKYSFMPGFPSQTAHETGFVCEKSKTKQNLKKFFKDNRIQWEFGAFSEEAREC